jgi:hypothetical protein
VFIFDEDIMENHSNSGISRVCLKSILFKGAICRELDEPMDGILGSPFSGKP